MPLASFIDTNEDVFFLMYNSFNEFYMALQRSSQFFVDEQLERTQESTETCTLLFSLAAAFIGLSFFSVIPVVDSVNKTKDKVLYTFCEIENQAIKVLAFRCERFINNLQAEEANEDIESSEDLENRIIEEEADSDQYSLLSGSGKRMKKIKNKTKINLKFLLRHMMGLLILMAYFLGNYMLIKDYEKTTVVLTNELENTSRQEALYWMAINAQRELMHDPNFPVMN